MLYNTDGCHGKFLKYQIQVKNEIVLIPPISGSLWGLHSPLYPLGFSTDCPTRHSNAFPGVWLQSHLPWAEAAFVKQRRDSLPVCLELCCLFVFSNKALASQHESSSSAGRIRPSRQGQIKPRTLKIQSLIGRRNQVLDTFFNVEK